MNFSQMHERVRSELLRRFQRGEITITMLARQTELSKSHVSKFLRGTGEVSNKAIDRIVKAQRLRMVDPFDFGPHIHQRADRIVEVPVVWYASGLFKPEIRSDIEIWLPVMHSALHLLRQDSPPSRRSWRRFVAMRIDREGAKSMNRPEYEDAVAIIDRHYNSLNVYHPSRENLYAVQDHSRVVLRHIDKVGNHLVLRPANMECRASLIEIPANANLRDYIAGRVAIIQFRT